jgi:hypothetical protein
VEKKEDIIIIKEKVYKSSELICNSLEKIKTKDILELLKLIETLNIKINSLLCKNLLSVISCVSLLERIGEKQDLKILFREYLANSELSL